MSKLSGPLLPSLIVEGIVSLILIYYFLNKQKISFEALFKFLATLITVNISITIPIDLIYHQPMGTTLIKIKELFWPPDEKVYLYDTDPQNDSYIRGNLTRPQLEALDKILEHEKNNGGYKLPGFTLKAISKNEPALIDGYARWRVCCDLRRSFGHVIYPSERERIHYYKKGKK
jgi:hypothetical protein